MEIIGFILISFEEVKLRLAIFREQGSVLNGLGMFLKLKTGAYQSQFFKNKDLINFLIGTLLNIYFFA